MNKDTVVASVIGFGLGLVAAIALWVVPRIIPKTIPTKTDTQVLSDSSKITENGNPQFEITSPVNGDISKTKDIKVTGKAKPSSIIIVTSSDTAQSVNTESSGSFTVPLTLHEGANEIAVTQIEGGSDETKQLYVYFVTDSL